MKEIFVADLASFENQIVTSFFVVASRQLRGRKDGGQYLAVTLVDRTGQVESRMWDNFSPVLDDFDQGDVVKIRGEVSRYNSRFQITLEKIRRALQEEVDWSDFLPQTSLNVDELWSTLNSYVDSFSNVHLQALLRAFLDDEQIAQALRQAPAAKSLHHAWLGGLLFPCWGSATSPRSTIPRSTGTCSSPARCFTILENSRN
jgi:3'-5' exoribonuclease